MTVSHSISRFLALGAVCALLSSVAIADDWPQWRGPNRDGVSKEIGLLKQWPTEGPKLLWKSDNLGLGHATPSIAQGRIYGMGLRNEDEVVWALDEKTGKEIWSTKIAGFTQLGGRQGGYGSRATPTVDGTKLYVIGVGGAFCCLNTTDGKLLWSKSLVSDFGGDIPQWGYSESALVDDGNVIATPGGNMATLVALNKVSGEVAWKSQVPTKNDVAYSSSIIAEIAGKRQYIQFLAGGVVGVSATDGKMLWRFDAPASSGGINCSTPIYKDGYVFAAAGYQHGGALGKIESANGALNATQVYFTRDMQNHHGGMVLVGDHLYGFDDRNRKWTCLEFKTGTVVWSAPGVGKGSVTCADGMLYCRSERGPVALVEASPKAYNELGRFEQPDRSRENSWPYPVVANGRLYLRDQGILLCYDVKGK